MKSPITTHILDTAQGRPASGVSVMLEFFESGEWIKLGKSQTDADGRITDLLSHDFKLSKGVYRLTFQTASYFDSIGVKNFYPYIPIIFEIHEITTHYHVPLLLNPFGYSTYRGS